ncbi:MAG: prepilin peptidase [Gammaproteobacteria bacterium]|nr:prepilin peptidase [Gammaproteobacteria bacterium]
MNALDQFLSGHGPLFHSMVFMVGLAIGSFLNVVILRLPARMNAEWRRDCCALLGVEPSGIQDTPGLVRPGSRCPHCGHAITPLENIPVLSYLVLRGRCSSCRRGISVRYPLVELGTALLSVVVSLRFGFSLQTVAALVLTWGLIALSGIDLDHRLLPDDITMPLLWLGLLANMFMVFTGIVPALLGTMAGYLILWLVYHAFRILTGKEGMGYGDFKLLAALGAWNGIQMLPFMLVVASFVGALIGSAMMFSGRLQRSQPIPFGPYLALAGWLALLWGAQATQAYLNWAAR